MFYCFHTIFNLLHRQTYTGLPVITQLIIHCIFHPRLYACHVGLHLMNGSSEPRHHGHHLKRYRTCVHLRSIANWTTLADADAPTPLIVLYTMVKLTGEVAVFWHYTNVLTITQRMICLLYTSDAADE